MKDMTQKTLKLTDEKPRAHGLPIVMLRDFKEQLDKGDIIGAIDIVYSTGYEAGWQESIRVLKELIKKTDKENTGDYSHKKGLEIRL